MEKAFYQRPKSNGEPRRPMQKTPSSLGGLLGGMLARHGIGAQVLAARAVLRGNEILDSMVSTEQRQDFKVLSFNNNELTVICRNSSAKFFLNPQTNNLARRLEQELPEISVVNVKLELRPDDWSRQEAWES